MNAMQPLIITAVTAIVPAIVAYVVAWLRARTAAQERTLQSAVEYVEALEAEPLDLDDDQAAAAAKDFVRRRLPIDMHPGPADLESKVAARVAKRAKRRRAAE